MIHRSEHAKNFTMLNNEILESDLSDGAFRLLVFMLSCSDDWKFSLKGLAYCLGLSERTVSDRLTELKQAGYISQKRATNKRGQFEACDWDVYEEPLTTPQKNHSEVKPHRGKTTLRQNHTAVEPHCGKTAVIKQVPIITSTNINKYQRKEEAHALGFFQNVFLTDEEQKDLCERLGFESVVEYIERLSSYLHDNPNKKFKNHKATIEKWIKEDEGRTPA